MVSQVCHFSALNNVLPLVFEEVLLVDSSYAKVLDSILHWHSLDFFDLTNVLIIIIYHHHTLFFVDSEPTFFTKSCQDLTHLFCLFS